jgi:hypothetical protein
MSREDCLVAPIEVEQCVQQRTGHAGISRRFLRLPVRAFHRQFIKRFAPRNFFTTAGLSYAFVVGLRIAIRGKDDLT